MYKMPQTKKRMPWFNWSRMQPSAHQRTVMMRKCGKKCFLGPRKSFPICKKSTCTVCREGVYAAFVRARQYRKKSSKYYAIAKRAKTMLKRPNRKC